MSDNTLTDKPVKRGRPPGAGELATMRGVLDEMAKTYRAAKNGQLDHRDARSRIWMLAQIRDTIEVAEIEKTLARLEEALASRPTERPPLPKYNPAVTSHWQQ